MKNEKLSTFDPCQVRSQAGIPFSVVLVAFPLDRGDGVTCVSLAPQLLKLCVLNHFLASLSDVGCNAIDILESTPADSAADIILSYRPNLVGFPNYIWSHERLVSVARAVRRREPKVTIVAGGPNVLYEADVLLVEGILDYILTGEAENSLPQFIEFLKSSDQNAMCENIGGLMWVRPKGIVQ